MKNKTKMTIADALKVVVPQFVTKFEATNQRYTTGDIHGAVSEVLGWTPKPITFRQEVTAMANYLYSGKLPGRKYTDRGAVPLKRKLSPKAYNWLLENLDVVEDLAK